MHRSFAVACVASTFFALMAASRASASSDDIFIDGFEFRDFPATPIVDPSAPANAPALFGTSGAPGGGPCLADPQTGALFPNNWIRPRFTWTASGGENLFEVRLTAPNQNFALAVYTAGTSWTMPANIWAGLAQHTVDQPITVTVRGATYASGGLTSGPELGSSGTIQVAPVSAPGAIVYWSNTSSGMELLGFRMGDETLKDILSPADAGTTCVGCHTATPDGSYVGFSTAGGGTGFALRSADGQHLTPAYLSASAQTLMARASQEAPAFSPLHWTSGDRVALTMYQSQIMWTDLEATSTAQGGGWGFLARNGDTGATATASFAHTSDTVVYVSASSVTSGITVTDGTIKTVPFNNRAGGTSTTVVASADNEYYPSFSPDDRYIVYDSVPNGQSSYNNSQAEVHVAYANGAAPPVRLTANDPTACTSHSSPGVTNSWPKWAPTTQDNGGRRFYWLAFSSTRAGGPAQVYVAPIVDNGITLTTYPALYPWNQTATDDNHTPAWDNFAIPF